MADTAYDSDRLREAIARKKALAVIPKHPLDKHLCARRHVIKCYFSKLKQFRRVATRYEKTARNHLAAITIAAIVLWIKEVSTEPRAADPDHHRAGTGRSGPAFDMPKTPPWRWSAPTEVVHPLG